MPKGIEELMEEDERLESEISVAQKQALLKQAKEQYGNDYKRLFKSSGGGNGEGGGGGGGFKSGIDWEAMKFRIGH